MSVSLFKSMVLLLWCIFIFCASLYDSIVFPVALYEFYEMEQYGQANMSYVRYCSVDPYTSKDNIFTRQDERTCHIKAVTQTEFNTKHIHRNMFTTELNNLEMNTQYKYTVGSARTGWSDWLEFNTFKKQQGRTLQ